MSYKYVDSMSDVSDSNSDVSVDPYLNSDKPFNVIKTYDQTGYQIKVVFNTGPVQRFHIHFENNEIMIDAMLRDKNGAVETRYKIVTEVPLFKKSATDTFIENENVLVVRYKADVETPEFYFGSIMK